MDSASNAIASLEYLIKHHKIRIENVDQSVFANHWILVNFYIEDDVFAIQVDDEYSDFKIDSPALHLCLVLRSLEEYKDATDFLDWSKKTGIEPTNNALEYFRTLAPILVETEKIIEELDSKISDIEFNTNAGAAYELRNK
jgi:hypothetical protein